jgi:hypothetical protein
MRPGGSKEALLNRLKKAPDKTVAGTLQVMLDFYAEERAEGCCSVDEDGDMLLYQWGTYDWGHGEHFELNLTRQFILPGEHEPYQLSMTLMFEPTDESRQLDAGNRWCPSPDHLAEFRSFICQSAPHALLGARVSPHIAVDYTQV